ncbi:hypothetical protein R3P38DRAFT_3450686 [Favolaschia claudopus]|uniref:Uncharacterized protein n=1 Tax=Favolaschia claudopus TaxID=2862362 RepID=A0AAV9ZLS5_9AGAR
MNVKKFAFWTRGRPGAADLSTDAAGTGNGDVGRGDGTRQRPRKWGERLQSTRFSPRRTSCITLSRSVSISFVLARRHTLMTASAGATPVTRVAASAWRRFGKQCRGRKRKTGRITFVHDGRKRDQCIECDFCHCYRIPPLFSLPPSLLPSFAPATFRRHLRRLMPLGLGKRPTCDAPHLHPSSISVPSPRSVPISIASGTGGIVSPSGQSLASIPLVNPYVAREGRASSAALPLSAQIQAWGRTARRGAATKKPLTLSDIIPPPAHARAQSLSFLMETDDSLMKSNHAHVKNLPRPRVNSDTSIRRAALESSRVSMASMHSRTRSRPQSGISFIGLDSFQEVRRGFEFHQNRPAFYPPPVATNRQVPRAKQESVFSIASISSYGHVTNPGISDPFDYGLAMSSLRERPSSCEMRSPASAYGSHRLSENDTSTSRSSLAHQYASYGANGGRAAWAKHRQESRLPPFARGEPQRLRDRSSWDSIIDGERPFAEDPLFERTDDDHHAPTGHLLPPHQFCPLSVLSFNNRTDSPPRQVETMVTMLGGGHVRRRSIGYNPSPCAPNKARQPSTASTSSSKFGEERMIRARQGLLERQSLEESALVAEGEDFASSVFTRPAPSSKPQLPFSLIDNHDLKLGAGLVDVGDGGIHVQYRRVAHQPHALQHDPPDIDCSPDARSWSRPWTSAPLLACCDSCLSVVGFRDHSRERPSPASSIGGYKSSPTARHGTFVVDAGLMDLSAGGAEWQDVLPFSPPKHPDGPPSSSLPPSCPPKIENDIDSVPRYRGGADEVLAAGRAGGAGVGLKKIESVDDDEEEEGEEDQEEEEGEASEDEEDTSGEDGGEDEDGEVENEGTVKGEQRSLVKRREVGVVARVGVVVASASASMERSNSNSGGGADGGDFIAFSLLKLQGD